MTYAQEHASWKVLAVMCLAWALVGFVAGMALGYNEMDLPVLPPNDPRRTAPEPAHTPLPVEGPEPAEPPPGSVFYGEVVTGPDIVYVLDYSQSMGEVAERVDYRTTLNRWEVCQRQATSSILALDSRSRFGVVVFGTSGGCGVRIWRQRLEQATTSAKAAAVDFIQSFPDVMFLGGATPTAQAVIRAIRLLPDRIVLLTDGQPSPCGYADDPTRAHREAIRKANENQVPIDVFGVGMWQKPREFCSGVASDSGGTFYEVPNR